MRFKDVFSIIGPGMVGPSSSHTAGAVRLGRVARKLFGALPEKADITLYGSFADTYRGHGTDLALTAGLLDYDTDDLRIRRSAELAEEAGMKVVFTTSNKAVPHPNTAKIVLTSGDRQETVVGSSIGGGNIEITSVNGYDVKFSANYPTLLVFHKDRPGMIASITQLLGAQGVNISFMDVDRKGRLSDALTVIETDEQVPDLLLKLIERLPDVNRVVQLDLTSREVSP
jgi:L-serine dehydratase